MALREAYRDYLAAGARATDAMPLAAAIADAELEDLAGAIVRFADRGPQWFERPDGGRAFVGPQPPDAEPGDLWIDSCELAAMILLPAYVDIATFDERPWAADLAADRNYDCWFSLTPVRKFQLGAFLDVAPLRREKRRRDWLDPARLLGGDELDPATGLSFDEVRAYLSWFGKGSATERDWQAAWQHFGLAPWSSVEREFGGASSATSGFALVIGPEVLDGAEPDDDADDDSGEYGEHDRLDGGFRSAFALTRGRVIDDRSAGDVVTARIRRGG